MMVMVDPPSVVSNSNSNVPVWLNVTTLLAIPWIFAVPTDTAAGRVRVCAVDATVMRSLTRPSTPAAGKLVNAMDTDPDVVKV